MDKKMLIKIVASVAIIVLVFAIGVFIGTKLDFNSKKTENEQNNSINDKTKAINFYEDFSKIEEVKNLSNVVWNSVRITQIENKMEVNVLLNNQSKDKKAEETNLTVNLYDRNGNVVLTKNAKMPEIKANYGTATLNLEFDIDEIMVIYDVQVIANK